MSGFIGWIFDCLMLASSFLLIASERLLTSITLFLPQRVLDFCGKVVNTFIHAWPSRGQLAFEDNEELSSRVDKVCDASGFLEICDIHGYEAEEHVIPTRDGYLLNVHRIGGPRHTKWRYTTELRPVVYLHHGLLMNSEVWIAVPDHKDSIAFALADLGYDVWLGNNRGNKYSKKHISRKPQFEEFWNFGLDEFALYDIPDTVDYILSVTNQPNLAYIGFSQGSAQAFAALSIHPNLNHQINLFVALGPAMAPPGINSFIQSLINASPNLIYAVFGHRILLRSTVFWQSVMLPGIFMRAIDVALDLLFSWKGRNITYAQRLTGYAHLYSYTSVKSVVHWFQIIRSGVFQMYDDEMLGPFQFSRFSRVPHYPTNNIITPLEVIYGTQDTLLDIDSLSQALPSATNYTPIEGYEHLEMIWGKDVRTLILPKIAECLASRTMSQLDNDDL